MDLSYTPGAINKFGRTAWKFQKTFRTPRKNLHPCVSSVVAAVPTIQEACLTIDKVVFEPKNLMALMTRCSAPLRYGRDITMTASGTNESEALLLAALSDWVDFLFVPRPKPFLIYADHDEYATFYTQTLSNRNVVSRALVKQGIGEIVGYRRHF
jgi:hypothetical protein